MTNDACNVCDLRHASICSLMDCVCFLESVKRYCCEKYFRKHYQYYSYCDSLFVWRFRMLHNSLGQYALSKWNDEENQAEWKQHEVNQCKHQCNMAYSTKTKTSFPVNTSVKWVCGYRYLETIVQKKQKTALRRISQNIEMIIKAEPLL